MASPKVFDVVDGYYFKGGDPNQESSWVKYDPKVGFAKPEKPTFTESVGRGAMDVAQGLKQIVSGEDYTKKVEDEISLYEAGQGGDMDWGRLTGNVAATAPASMIAGGAGATSILRAGAAGAAAGGSQFVKEGDSRGENALVGGILGAGVQSIPAGYQALKNVSKPSATRAAAASAAESMNVRPTPAQQTGSRTLQRIEAGMENTAGGGVAMEQLGRANQKSINKEIAKRLGIDSDVLDRQTLGKALDKIEGMYSSALGNVTLKPDAKFVNDLAKVGTEFSAPGTKLPTAIKDAIDDPRFLEPMSARDYNRARSLYGKNAVEAYRAGKSTEAQAWDALQEAVDEMAKRNLPADKAASLDKAREGYRILKTVEKAADPHTGNVSPQKLVNSIRQKDPRGFLYGRGDNPLMDVADSAAFLKQPPDSFTASRMAGMVAPSILGGAYGAHEGGPQGAAAGFLLGTAAPYALTKGYLGLTKPQSILGAGAQRTLPYLYPAMGSAAAQP